MLTHLPGRMSQPSRKGVTSNIFILRCSFHKTAKRLSITGLTHLLRLRPKKNTIQYCKAQQKWPFQLKLWFCYKQNGKEIRSITKTLNCQNKWQNFRLLSNGETKITDWITSQKPTCRRHPINLNNNITDISQKKDLPTSANDTNIYRLSLWYKQQWKVEVAYSKCNTTLH